MEMEVHTFTLNVNPINENNTIVHIDGVYQQKSSYTVQWYKSFIWI